MSMFRSLMAQQSTPQPEYEFLTRIRATGSQHINFPDIIPYNHKLEIKLQMPRYNNDNHLWGANYMGEFGDGARYFSMTTYNRKYYWGTNGDEMYGGTWNSNENIIIYNDFNDHEVKVNGTTIGSGNEIYTEGYFYLFKRANAYAPAENSGKYVGYIYYCKMWDRDTEELVLDLVPARRLSDSVLGLYDNVTNTFFENNGTGSFVAD